MTIKEDLGQANGTKIEQKILNLSLAPDAGHDLVAFLKDKDTGISFIRLFQSSNSSDHLSVAITKQLLLCVCSPDSAHLLMAETSDKVPNLISTCKSALDELGLIYETKLAPLSKLLVYFCGSRRPPATILFSSPDQVNRLHGLRLASAVFCTTGNPQPLIVSRELQVVRCRIRAGSCQQIAIVGTGPLASA